MKKIFITVAACFLMFIAVGQGNIDRSKPPKAGPAPVISFKDPVMYKLSNGITVLVVENHTLPQVSASYFIDMGPVTEGDKTGTLSLMGQMLNEGTINMTKEQFDEAVDQIGANVSLTWGGGNVTALTRYFEQAFMLMADALLNPAFPDESFQKLKSQTLTGLKANEKNAKAISANVVNAVSFGLNHPMGEFETEQTINNITLDDVKKAYKKYITPSRGYLTFVGDIAPLKAKEIAEKALGRWKGASLTLPVLKNVPNPAKTEINFVDVPNAVQSEITVTNLVSIPMSSPDYFAVLLTNQILGGGADSRLFMNLREAHGFTYGSYSNIGTGRYQSKFSATASVRNDKTDSAVAEILREIDTIRTQKVSAQELKNVKALYNGSFALQLENPALTASFARNILLNNLPKDFYRTYLQKINAVTADDILRVAKKYFNYSNTRIVVVGKQADVLPGLKALGYPIRFFDRNAKPVEENASAARKTDVIPVQVIEKYIRVIGGKEALEKVQSVVSEGTMEISGMSLNVLVKKESPNKELMSVTMGGQIIIKSVFDGVSGYQAQMGQKEPFDDDIIKDKKAVTSFFPQLSYSGESFKTIIKGIEKVGEADAYVMEVTKPSGSVTTEFYDVNTGLLIKQIDVVKTQGTEVTQTSEMSDYRKVGDVLIPHQVATTINTQMGSQELVFKYHTVKINEPVSAEDFK